MTANANFQSIPIVDLSNARSSEHDRRELAGEMGAIFHHVGFMVVVNHGISSATIDRVFSAAAEFFALPDDQKRRMDKRQSRYFRGWEPEGTERTNNRPDIREQIDHWTPHPPREADVSPPYLRLLGPNQWLPEEDLPGFKAAVEAWIQGANQLAGDIMQLLALSLELPGDYFERRFGDEPMSLTKIIRYPATPRGQFGVNAHHDAGFVTVLSPGQTPGLEVQNAAGEWIPVPIVDDGLVINLGENLQAMTGNYFVATPHRVRTSVPRQSVGYFHGPSLDASLTAIELGEKFRAAVAASARHASAGFMAQADETESGVGDMASPHHPETYGEQLWNYFRRSYPEHFSRYYSGL